MLAAFAAVRRAHAHALLVIAPRKPERFAEAEALARAEGLRVVRRTELAVDAEPRADVVILDTIGELAHAVSGRDGRVRRRQPGRPGRAQHSRAGRARQADRVRAAHAELCGDRRRRSCATRRPSRSPTPPTVGGRRAADGRSGRARAPRRRGARAGRGQSRRQAAHARRRSPICSRRPAAGGSCARFGSCRFPQRGTGLFSTDWGLSQRWGDFHEGDGLAGASQTRPSSVESPASPRRRPRSVENSRPSLWKSPVISVGNLAMGGRGKTPVVAPSRAAARRGGRAARDSQPRLRPAPPPKTAWSSSATARICAPTSTAAATSR